MIARDSALPAFVWSESAEDKMSQMGNKQGRDALCAKLCPKVEVACLQNYKWPSLQKTWSLKTFFSRVKLLSILKGLLIRRAAFHLRTEDINRRKSAMYHYNEINGNHWSKWFGGLITQIDSWWCFFLDLLVYEATKQWIGATLQEYQ